MVLLNVVFSFYDNFVIKLNTWIKKSDDDKIDKLNHSVCDEIPSVENSAAGVITKRNLPSKNEPQNLTAGSVVKYTCNKYYRQDVYESTCGHDGKWSPVQCYPGFDTVLKPC